MLYEPMKYIDGHHPPTNLYSDEPPLETDLHRQHIDLLIRLLQYWWHGLVPMEL